MSHPDRIEAATASSPLFKGALSVARRAHAGQERETGAGPIPFIEHPIAVAQRLLAYDYPVELAAAGLLHDTVERAGVDPETIRKRFGDQIGEMVETLTENTTISSLEERKEELRKRVAAADPATRAIFAADRGINVLTLREAYEIVGEEVETGMPASLDLKVLTWELDLEMLFAAEEGVPLIEAFADEMVGLWGQRAGNPEPLGG